MLTSMINVLFPPKPLVAKRKRDAEAAKAKAHADAKASF